MEYKKHLDETTSLTTKCTTTTTLGDNSTCTSNVAGGAVQKNSNRCNNVAGHDAGAKLLSSRAGAAEHDHGGRDTTTEGRTSPAVTGIVVHAAALIHAIFTVAVALFQLALALGAPWGEYAMGGIVPPGRSCPPILRLVAIVQAILLLLMTEVVLARGGLIVMRQFFAGFCCCCCCSPRDGRYWLTIWVVVTYSAVALFLNIITPSAKERVVWAPVALVLLTTSTIVATWGD